MSKKLDPDFKGLKTCVRGMEFTTPRMRKATLEYLWDRYINQPIRDLHRQQAKEVVHGEA